MSERLPSIPLPQPPAYSSGTSSPRLSSIGSSIGDSHSSWTSAASSSGPKTPSPNLPLISALCGPPHPYDQYPAMNPASDMYYQSMSAGPAPSHHTVTSHAVPHYGHSQPTLLQPGPAQYQGPYYGSYSNGGMTSPQSTPPVSHAMGPLPLPGVQGQQGMQGQYQGAGMDVSGQVPPIGVKQPRVTATLWEDESSLCFQVEARDNHMINGTKLLNVAGMTRGRRDGILKSEKVRHVVKIGPMHLKGVWIPFERALDFANKEKITEILYPLFVHNIGALICPNGGRQNQVMAAAERRRQDQQQQQQQQQHVAAMRHNSAGGGPLPSLHHHSMTLPGPQSQLPSHVNSGRPSIDRSQTFPTPPASATMMGNMGSSDHYQTSWNHQHMNGGPHHGHQMSLDTSLNTNERSMPNTPATTPPGTSLHTMHPYHGSSYDSTRGLYSSPAAQQSSYPATTSSPQDRSAYGANHGYMRSDMAPPLVRANGPGEHDVKVACVPHAVRHSTNGMSHAGHQGETASHAGNEEEAETEAEYTHNSGAYDTNRTPYNYEAPPTAPLAGEHGSDVTGSPSHPAGSGRATPRTTAPAQPYYQQQQSDYGAPRPTPNLYNHVNADRASNGTSNGDVYGSQADMGAPVQNGYASIMNGSSNNSLKRSRDGDEESPRMSNGELDHKRRKTLNDPISSIPSGGYDMARPIAAIPARRR